jgi:hypothetical protein
VFEFLNYRGKVGIGLENGSVELLLEGAHLGDQF